MVQTKVENSALQLSSAANIRKIWGDLIYNVKVYGAKGDGTHDDTESIITVFNTAKGKGKVYFPPGTYLISSTVAIILDADVDVEMDLQAKIITTDGFNGKLFQFYSGAAYGYPRFRWLGGVLDASKVLFIVGGSTDCIWVSGSENMLVQNVTFYFGPDYVTPAGDNGVGPLNCRNVTIKDCWFFGAPDTGIYVSGDADEADPNDDGYLTIITNNHFIKCGTAITSKRLNKGLIVTNNTFYRCAIGIMPLETAGMSVGTGWIISGNYFKFTQSRAIAARLADGSIITNNRIEDFGYELDGVTLFPSFPKAISMEGSRNGIISNNWIGFKEWTPPVNSTRGIFLAGFLNSEGETRYAQRNIIEGNVIENVEYGITEETIDSGENTIGLNRFVNCTLEASLKSPLTVYLRYVNGALRWNVGGLDKFEVNTDGIKVNNTSSVKAFCIGSANLDFPSTAAGAASELTMTVLGARMGDGVSITPNAASYGGTVEFFGRVTANDIVTVRCRNFGGVAVDHAPINIVAVCVRG